MTTNCEYVLSNRYRIFAFQYGNAECESEHAISRRATALTLTFLFLNAINRDDLIFAENNTRLHITYDEYLQHECARQYELGG